MKSLFLADKAHLNRFGRPITFDNYTAMWHGPVPSLSYDLLKENPTVLKRYEITDLPWQRVSAEHVGKGCFHFYDAEQINAYLEELSESDLTLLKTSLDAILDLTFRQIRELTHNDEAYKEAWAFVGEGKSNPMSLGLLFDTPDFETAQILEAVSHQQAMCEGLSDEYIDSLRPRTLTPGDIVKLKPPMTGHRKYHLCIVPPTDDLPGWFLFLNSDNERQDDLLLTNSDLPCVPACASGKTIISCSFLVPLGVACFSNQVVEKYGRLDPPIARRLETALKPNTSLSVKQKRLVIQQLGFV